MWWSWSRYRWNPVPVTGNRTTQLLVIWFFFFFNDLIKVFFLICFLFSYYIRNVLAISKFCEVVKKNIVGKETLCEQYLVVQMFSLCLFSLPGFLRMDTCVSSKILGENVVQSIFYRYHIWVFLGLLTISGLVCHRLTVALPFKDLPAL